MHRGSAWSRRDLGRPLSTDGIAILRKLAKRLGVSQAVVTELALRDSAAGGDAKD
jgi:hypothetical protein